MPENSLYSDMLFDLTFAEKASNYLKENLLSTVFPTEMDTDGKIR
jgi:hypothetical protein